MLHMIPYNDFTLVIPGPEAEAAVRQSVLDGVRANREYLDALVEKPLGGRITGSFIYSHPPDYIGRPTMHFRQAEWQAQLRELKEMGIDTVIYQAAVWSEIRETNYPSRLFNDYKTWDSLGPLCDAVTAEGMTLYLGGLGNMIGFDPNVSAEELSRDCGEQLACFEELLAYRGGFHGFYLSPETGFPGVRQPEREAKLNHYFRSICQGVRAMIPGLPILASPGTYYYEGLESETRDFLIALFQGVGIDDMAPQDSIGTFGNRLKTLAASFQIWKDVCAATGMKLWVNVESFQRAEVNTTSDFVPADFERLAVQLHNASQVGEKIVSWEVPYFYSALAGERGLRLRQAYLDSIARGER
jgi:hypothetical protein